LNYTLESNVPLQKHMDKSVMPWMDLKDGQSFFVPTHRENAVTKAREIKDKAKELEAIRGKHFECRVVVGGVRVWRMEQGAKVDRKVVPPPPAITCPAIEKAKAIVAKAKPPIPSKKCRTCGEVKPLTEFYKGRNSDGLRSECKECVKAQVKRSAQLRKDPSPVDLPVPMGKTVEEVVIGGERIGEITFSLTEAPADRPINVPVKRCSQCDQCKPFNQFATDKNHTDGLKSYCNECGKVYKQRSRANAKARKAKPTPRLSFWQKIKNAVGL